MDDKELHQLLERLHDEIEGAQSVDDETRAHLKEIGTDIRDLLARSEGKPKQAESSLLDRMSESIENLEVTHPSLTGLLSELLTALSKAGI